MSEKLPSSSTRHVSAWTTFIMALFVNMASHSQPGAVVTTKTAVTQKTVTIDMNSTDNGNYTDLTTPIPKQPVQDLNRSIAFKPFWILTVLQVDLWQDVSSANFWSTMEERLVSVYHTGYQRRNSLHWFSRVRRAASLHNITLQMINISRPLLDQPWSTHLVYYMMRDQSIITASSAVEIIGLLHDQEVAIILGYVVLSKASVYAPPPVHDRRLWIIGVVFGGIIFTVIVVWCILFVYCKLNRQSYQRDVDEAKMSKQDYPFPLSLDADPDCMKETTQNSQKWAVMESGSEKNTDRRHVDKGQIVGTGKQIRRHKPLQSLQHDIARPVGSYDRFKDEQLLARTDDRSSHCSSEAYSLPEQNRRTRGDAHDLNKAATQQLHSPSRDSSKLIRTTKNIAQSKHGRHRKRKRKHEKSTCTTPTVMRELQQVDSMKENGTRLNTSMETADMMIDRRPEVIHSSDVIPNKDNCLVDELKMSDEKTVLDDTQTHQVLDACALMSHGMRGVSDRDHRDSCKHKDGDYELADALHHRPLYVETATKPDHLRTENTWSPYAAADEMSKLANHLPSEPPHKQKSFQDDHQSNRPHIRRHSATDFPVYQHSGNFNVPDSSSALESPYWNRHAAPTRENYPTQPAQSLFSRTYQSPQEMQPVRGNAFENAQHVPVMSDGEVIPQVTKNRFRYNVIAPAPENQEIPLKPYSYHWKPS